MKKLLVFALILSLVLAMPAFAEADADDNVIHAAQMDWNEEAEQVFTDAGYSGTWTTLEGIGCDLIIPEGYVQQELTDQDRADNYAFIFANAENGGKIEVFDSIIQGVEDLETLGKKLQEKSPEDPVQYAIINGAAAVINSVGDYDMTSAIFDLGNSRFVQIMFTPMSKATQLLTLCMASIKFPVVG